MPEVGGDAAHFIDPYDVDEIREGVLRLCQDEEYRRQLVENGFRNVERFSAAQVALQYSDLYRRVLESE